MDVEQIFVSLKSTYPSFDFCLKPEQKNVLGNVINGKSVIAVLPTGYGKSLCYMLPPLLLDEIDPESGPHISVVVSPLKALMMDQVIRCEQLGIKAVMITQRNEMKPGSVKAVEDGSMSLLFSSPEALQCGPWLNLIKKYKKRVCLLAFDELHCLSEWGNDFRPEYLQSVELRSIFSSIPCLGLTATMNSTLYDDVIDKLRLNQHQISTITRLPDRPNIFLEVVHAKSYDFERDLLWLIDGLREMKDKFPKTVIYAHSVSQVSDIYEFLKTSLGKDAYVDNVRDLSNRLLSLFHAHIAQDLREFTLTNFPLPDCKLRVLISTIAFGMGVEIPDIRTVVHWGKTKSVLSYWQEVGRCGRDGKPAKAIWYPKSVAGEDSATFSLLKTDINVCIRHVILETFVLSEIDRDYLDCLQTAPCNKGCENCECERCKCCSHCRIKCTCR